MACVQHGEPDFPKIDWKYKDRGLYPALKFMVTREKDTLTAITRGACFFFSWYFICHQYYAAANYNSVPEMREALKDDGKLYMSALFAHAATSLIRLFYRIKSDIKLDQEFFICFLSEDSFQQLCFSAIFLLDYFFLGTPDLGMEMIILSPICLSSLLHFSGYLMSFFYVLGFKCHPIMTFLGLIVGRKAFLIVQILDFMEAGLVMPFAAFALISFLLNRRSALTAISVVLYSMYLFLRTKTSNNQYGSCLVYDVFYLIYFVTRRNIHVFIMSCCHLYHELIFLWPIFLKIWKDGVRRWC